MGMVHCKLLVISRIARRHQVCLRLRICQNRFGVMQLTGILVKVDDVEDRSPFPPRPWIDVPVAHLMPTSHDHLLAMMQRCPIVKRRFEIIRYLGLPDCLFNFCDKSLRCFCGITSGCFCSSASEKSVFERGGQQYRLPVGYTGFGLQVSAPKFESKDVWDSWPVAYHGTTIHAVKSILQTGILLPTGFTGPDGKKIGGRDEKGRRADRMPSSAKDDSNGKIFFSPVISYASHIVHATPDIVQLRGCRIKVSVVLQLRVHPSFSKQPSTIEGFKLHHSQMQFSGQEEWFTE